MTELLPKEIVGNPFAMLAEQWALVTVEDGGKANPMTVSWGGLGVLWSKPVATIYIRPQRYTHQLLEQEELFTVSFYGEEQRAALKLCGARSGRELDKAAACGLTLKKEDGFCYYEEAELVLCCRKIYRDRIRPEGFLADDIDGNYPGKDYHDLYIGEIVRVLKKD
ncbi:MAG: flavin reductase family protein [Oscillospiraceae bacterium]|nr:flavin reductase family protein [Oscillospiraceae bacterium]